MLLNFYNCVKRCVSFLANMAADFFVQMQLFATAAIAAAAAKQKKDNQCAAVHTAAVIAIAAKALQK